MHPSRYFDNCLFCNAPVLRPRLFQSSNTSSSTRYTSVLAAFAGCGLTEKSCRAGPSRWASWHNWGWMRGPTMEPLGWSGSFSCHRVSEEMSLLFVPWPEKVNYEHRPLESLEYMPSTLKVSPVNQNWSISGIRHSLMNFGSPTVISTRRTIQMSKCEGAWMVVWIILSLGSLMLKCLLFHLVIAWLCVKRFQSCELAENQVGFGLGCRCSSLHIPSICCSVALRLKNFFCTVWKSQRLSSLCLFLSFLSLLMLTSCRGPPTCVSLRMILWFGTDPKLSILSEYIPGFFLIIPRTWMDPLLTYVMISPGNELDSSYLGEFEDYLILYNWHTRKMVGLEDKYVHKGKQQGVGRVWYREHRPLSISVCFMSDICLRIFDIALGAAWQAFGDERSAPSPGGVLLLVLKASSEDKWALSFAYMDSIPCPGREQLQTVSSKIQGLLSCVGSTVPDNGLHVLRLAESNMHDILTFIELLVCWGASRLNQNRFWLWNICLESEGPGVKRTQKDSELCVHAPNDNWLSMRYLLMDWEGEGRARHLATRICQL